MEQPLRRREKEALPSSSEEKKNTASSKLLLDRLLESLTTEESRELAPGVVIRDTYQLYRFLGKGGMGEVWQALDLIREAGDASEKDKYVAIKFLSKEVRNHPYALKALVREFSRYRWLIHPNIVRAYELNRDRDQIYIVLEFLEGASLKEWIQSHPEGTEPEEAEPLIRGMCAGLSYAHRQGILHMDFKPSNVFYDPESRTAKVIDFGIARLSDPEEREKTRFDPGKLAALSEAYASPEMLSGVDPDRRDDMYGLACVSYEIFSGRHPFDRVNALAASHQGLKPQPIPSLTDRQNHGLLQALSFQREDRLDDPEKLYEVLYEQPLSGESGASRRLPRFMVPVAAAVAVLLFLAAFFWGYSRWREHAFEQALIDGQAEAVAEFIVSKPKDQGRVLRNQAVRKALIGYWLDQPGMAIFQVLDQLPDPIQRTFLSDLRVRRILIQHYLEMAKQLSEEGELARARFVLQQLFQRYPDSGSLDDTIQQIQDQILDRAQDLEKRYKLCFRKRDASCFGEVREQLVLVAPEHPLFSDPKLVGWLHERTTAALKQGQLDLAADLLQHWQTWFPGEDAERQRLFEQLSWQQSIASWRNRLKGEELGSALVEFRQLDDPLRTAVLKDWRVDQQILAYYSDRVKAQVKSDHYLQAIATLNEARELLNKHSKIKRSLIQAERRVKRSQQQRASVLVGKMRSLLKQGVTDVETIQGLHDQLAVVDPVHPALGYPDLPRYYRPGIEKALAQESLTETEKLLQAWSALRPDDTKDLQGDYSKLKRAHQDLTRRLADRLQWIRRIDNAIAQGDEEMLLQLLDELPDVQRKSVLREVKARLVSFYRSKIDQALQQDRFVQADSLLASVSGLYPDTKVTNPLQQTIVQARQQRMASLNQAFGGALKRSPVDYQQLFVVLTAMVQLDSASKTVADSLSRLKRHTLGLVQNDDDSLPALRKILKGWKGLSDKYPPVAETLSETSNLLALRLLLKGRQLTAQEKSGKAAELFRFSLSLKPVPTLRKSLQTELAKLESGPNP